MLPTNWRMILNIEQHIQQVTTIPGINLCGSGNYAAFTMETEEHGASPYKFSIEGLANWPTPTTVKQV
ncbi:hypothetical protein DFP72DRAFT_1060135 [Ephemerocybe angulata]|uniref:Uncharacterized protein n=1 Tax=Ephemerocybe angulata TaxID=980116 RepID=A0A8H6MEK8_9AGAR|nr:hypothetical protein DFP72DRAFT_1060135 [Tulosesus angulatus]